MQPSRGRLALGYDRLRGVSARRETTLILTRGRAGDSEAPLAQNGISRGQRLAVSARALSADVPPTRNCVPSDDLLSRQVDWRASS
jgi:hypothetical protein